MITHRNTTADINITTRKPTKLVLRGASPIEEIDLLLQHSCNLWNRLLFILKNSPISFFPNMSPESEQHSQLFLLLHLLALLRDEMPHLVHQSPFRYEIVIAR
jgi:hypothetical protein